jgi:hypothetical protein
MPSAKGRINGVGTVLLGSFNISGRGVSLKADFSPPIPELFSSNYVTLQYRDPSDLYGTYIISQGSQIGPSTINLILTSPDGGITLQLYGPLYLVGPGSQVTGQVTFSGGTTGSTEVNLEESEE